MRGALRLLLAVGLVLTAGVLTPVQAQSVEAMAVRTQTVHDLTVEAPTFQGQTFHTPAEEGFIAAINASRAGEGLEPLLANAELRQVARGWTTQLRDAGRLSHNPAYAQQYTGQWTRMGENVGTATARASADALTARLHQAFLDSPGHRANIMGDYNQVGVGVVVDGSTMWVTVNFLQGPVPVTEPVGEPPPQPEVPLPGAGHFTRR